MKSRKREACQSWSADSFRPADLEVVEFERMDVAFAVLSFSMPRFDLPARLSPAEREVARLLCEGWSLTTIAQRRQRSRFTVVNQVRSIYAKLGVTSHADLLHALTTG
jgi:DNA-binding NarL/FixJ family response regulator